MGWWWRRWVALGSTAGNGSVGGGCVSRSGGSGTSYPDSRGTAAAHCSAPHCLVVVVLGGVQRVVDSGGGCVPG